jgi:hypothetical protein
LNKQVSDWQIKWVSAKKQPIKEMTMREMLRKTRDQQRMKEEMASAIEPVQQQVTPVEQKEYERNMLDYFNNDNVTIKFEPILIYDEGVFLGRYH